MDFSINGNTNSVQQFIRLVAFIVTYIVLGVIFILPVMAFSRAIFSTPWILGVPFIALTAWISSIISKMLYILPEWEKMVVLRLGQYDGVRGAGFFIIPPFIYSVAAILDTRIETHQVEATSTLTKDNVPTKVTAAIEFRVEDPKKAVMDVQNYRNSVTWLSTEALKNTIGSLDLKELLSERDIIADNLRRQIDEGAAVYGIDVKAVRLTDIDTPQSLVEELAVIARARRSAEAKLIQANAEIEVANKTAEASAILSSDSKALQLRELQLLSEMSKEQGSMIIIYPYGDKTAQDIANSMPATHKLNIKGEHKDQ